MAKKKNAETKPFTVQEYELVANCDWLMPVRKIEGFHCIDNTVYHIGASLKDLGKRWFAFSKMEMNTNELLKNIE